MSIPNPNFDLIEIKLNDKYSAAVRSTDLNFKSLVTYLNLLRDYTDSIPIDVEVDEADIITALKNQRKVRTIPNTLGNGAVHTFSDGVTVTRVDNTYTISTGVNTEAMTVTFKNNADKKIIYMAYQTTTTNIIFNTATTLTEDIDVIYYNF